MGVMWVEALSVYLGRVEMARSGFDFLVFYIFGEKVRSELVPSPDPNK